MAAVWVSLFKRMLYPVMYSYVRTGSADAITAQGIYSAIAVLAVAVVVLLVLRFGFSARTAAPAAMAIGLLGAAGMWLTANTEFSSAGHIAGGYVGSALVALYLPTHFAFWCLLLHGESRETLLRDTASGFALFVAAYGLLCLFNLDSKAVTVACPLLSTAMIAAALHQVRKGARGQTVEAGERRADSPTQAPIASSSAEPAMETAPDANTEATPAADAAPTQAAEPPAAPKAETSPSDKQGAEGIPLPVGFAEAFGLSEREAELAGYAYRNYSARRIAGELFIAESTVYTHLKRIYRKTDVHSKQELIDLIDTWPGR